MTLEIEVLTEPPQRRRGGETTMWGPVVGQIREADGRWVKVTCRSRSAARQAAHRLRGGKHVSPLADRGEIAAFSTDSTLYAALISGAHYEPAETP